MIKEGKDRKAVKSDLSHLGRAIAMQPVGIGLVAKEKVEALKAQIAAIPKFRTKDEAPSVPVMLRLPATLVARLDEARDEFPRQEYIRDILDRNLP